jgi:hypothetical protein
MDFLGIYKHRLVLLSVVYECLIFLNSLNCLGKVCLLLRAINSYKFRIQNFLAYLCFHDMLI